MSGKKEADETNFMHESFLLQVLTAQQTLHPQVGMASSKPQQAQQTQAVAMVTQFVAMPQSPAVVAMAPSHQVHFLFSDLASFC